MVDLVGGDRRSGWRGGHSVGRWRSSNVGGNMLTLK